MAAGIRNGNKLAALFVGVAILAQAPGAFAGVAEAPAKKESVLKGAYSKLLDQRKLVQEARNKMAGAKVKISTEIAQAQEQLGQVRVMLVQAGKMAEQKLVEASDGLDNTGVVQKFQAELKDRVPQLQGTEKALIEHLKELREKGSANLIAKEKEALKTSLDQLKAIKEEFNKKIADETQWAKTQEGGSKTMTALKNIGVALKWSTLKLQLMSASLATKGHHRTSEILSAIKAFPQAIPFIQNWMSKEKADPASVDFQI